MRSERRSIKSKLFISLGLVILISLVSAISFFTFYHNFVTTEVAIAYLGQHSNDAREQFNIRIQKHIDNLILLKNWTNNGLIELNSNQNLEQVLLPVLNESPDFYALTIYNSLGYEYIIKKEANKYYSSYFNLHDSITLSKKLEKSGQLISNWKADEDIKPVLQPWIKKDTINNGIIDWYGPGYSSDYDQNILTLHISWKDSLNIGVINHVGISLLTSDLVKFVNNISKDSDNQYFMTNYDAELYTMNDESYFRNSLLIPYYKSEDTLKKQALKTWLDKGKPMQKPTDFVLDNKTYWMNLIYLNEINQKAILALVVPQKIFSESVREGNRNNFIFSFLFLIVGLGISLFFILRYTRQLKEVPKHRLNYDNFLVKFGELSNLPESKMLEFKSTVRYNLKAGKNDKNIELAWLKSVVAFMNTDGGNILIGVDDEGNILGIEKDAFENDDKAMLHVKNLIQTSIGIEYSKFITIVAKEIESKLVVGISCDQSSKPAFLKNGDSESFFIRSGPSSTKLSVSQAVEYVRNHGFKHF